MVAPLGQIGRKAWLGAHGVSGQMELGANDSQAWCYYAETNTLLLCIVEVSIPREKLNKRE